MITKTNPTFISLLKDTSYDSARLITFTLEDDIHLMQHNFNAIRDGFYLGVARPGQYIKLIADGHLQMSNTQMEHATNQLFAQKARGKVLVFGLGIGLIFDLVKWDQIKYLQIVEKNAAVINLMMPFIQAYQRFYPDRKIRVRQGDAYTYLPSIYYDTIYYDIWHDITIDNLETMTQFNNKSAAWLNPGGWRGCWSEPEIRSIYYCTECHELKNDCYCERCDYCDELIENCECERCPDCDEVIDECYCDPCEECGEQPYDCYC